MVFNYETVMKRLCVVAPANVQSLERRDGDWATGKRYRVEAEGPAGSDPDTDAHSSRSIRALLQSFSLSRHSLILPLVLVLVLR